MRNATSLALLFTLLSTAGLGCGMLAPGAHSPGSAQPNAAAYQVPQESKDTARAQEKKSFAMSEDAEDEDLDKLEKDVLKAANVALGKRPISAGGMTPESSSTVAKALRTSGIKVRIEPVTNEDGNAVADNFVQLKDSYTDRVQQLSRKLAEQRATPAEMKEVQSGSKYVMKLNDLRMQVLQISMSTLKSNNKVLTSEMTTIQKVAGMVRSRKMMSMDWTDDDYAMVQRTLTRLRRAEALAAASMGMLATYQAVLNNKGNPDALDAIADATSKAFPIKPAVTLDDAKQYVNNLGENAASAKAHYEAMMRKVMGDAKYEKTYKANIDQVFSQAATAGSQKSVTEMVSDTQAKFKADREKCARGEPVDPGSLAAGPGCKAAREAYLANHGGGGADSSGASGDGSGAQGQIADAQGRVNSGMAAADAASKGDVGGALGNAANVLPGDGPIKSSLQGMAAIAKGDPKGALSAAVGLVGIIPGGSVLKEGLGLATKLLGIFG